MISDDAEAFYDMHRALVVRWGVVLPSWEELSWDDQIMWSELHSEQLNRDKEAA